MDYYFYEEKLKIDTHSIREKEKDSGEHPEDESNLGRRGGG